MPLSSFEPPARPREAGHGELDDPGPLSAGPRSPQRQEHKGQDRGQEGEGWPKWHRVSEFESPGLSWEGWGLGHRALARGQLRAGGVRWAAVGPPERIKRTWAPPRAPCLSSGQSLHASVWCREGGILAWESWVCHVGEWRSSQQGSLESSDWGVSQAPSEQVGREEGDRRCRVWVWTAVSFLDPK